jgi:hypothetical protein
MQAKVPTGSIRVHRLRPNGSPDPHFGWRGATVVHASGDLEAAEAIAVDSHERVLLTTARTKRSCSTLCKRVPGKGPISVLAVFRLKADGVRDRQFGRRGTVLTGFGRNTRAYPRQALIDHRGRIIVGSLIDSPAFAKGNRATLTRYYGGR